MCRRKEMPNSWKCILMTESLITDYCKCLEPWIMETHDDYMCEKCGKRYG